MDDMGGELRCGLLSRASIYLDEFRWGDEDHARIYGECPDGLYEEFCLHTAKHVFRCCKKFTVTVASPTSAVVAYDNSISVSNFRSTVMNDYHYGWDESPSTCNAEAPVPSPIQSTAPKNHRLYVVELCYDDGSSLRVRRPDDNTTADSALVESWKRSSSASLEMMATLGFVRD
jgi:hypothetical protein